MNFTRSLTGEETGKRMRKRLTKRLLKATTQMRKSPPPIQEQQNIDSGVIRSVRTINTGLYLRRKAEPGCAGIILRVTDHKSEKLRFLFRRILSKSHIVSPQ